MAVSADEVASWSKSQVQQWLKTQGYENKADVLSAFSRNDVDGYVLLRLTEDDLRREPMGIPNLGAIKKIIGAVQRFENIDKHAPRYDAFASWATGNAGGQPRCRGFSVSDAGGADGEQMNERIYAGDLKPEKFKALIAGIYIVVVLYICAVIMTITNDRVPDMKKYPPLPDLFLDNVPFIPWAFTVAEYICLSLSTIFVCLLLTHKHRFIIIRRYFSLAGTLFLLRGVCMVITSLSVPCKSFKCQPTPKGEGIEERLIEALQIFFAGGMSINGIRHCGDYMFSGHTTLLTLINLFIDEYSPRGLPIVRTACWTANMFGIFFVMAGHEHYSIDVFIAFYLTTRLFLYYHTLADNHSRLRYDERNVRIWFPLFSYFESGCDGAIPYEFEWPFSLQSLKRAKRD